MLIFLIFSYFAIGFVVATVAAKMDLINHNDSGIFFWIMTCWPLDLIIRLVIGFMDFLDSLIKNYMEIITRSKTD